MSNEKVLATLFECIEIGKSYYFEGAYYRLKDYGDHIYGLQRAILDDYFCRNCCSNGIARSLSYKDVAFYTSSRYRQEVYLRNHAGFGKCDWELFY